jgi:hypothetical protein
VERLVREIGRLRDDEIVAAEGLSPISAADYTLLKERGGVYTKVLALLAAYRPGMREDAVDTLAKELYLVGYTPGMRDWDEKLPDGIRDRWREKARAIISRLTGRDE